ncbi:hypothetical protein C1H76_5528 [Elsinoe australis]|uniref:Importin N-terminal domain-containing protein n=1 Tax=Elsinoe australis TaxID=40998 RepID=A0A4U7AUU4_9PEZI|nr:hypothetical protein C1H76_5528 [Elsinoe australis]
MEAVEHAAALIARLNDPRQAHDANVISRQLQELQLSPHGWTIADNLLSAQDPNLQFYGALTFQIKLNRDAASLNPDDSQALLDRLIGNFTLCVNKSSPTRIVEKLCSVLATYLAQSTVTWNDPLGDVVSRLLQDGPRPSLQNSGRGDHAVLQLSSAQLLALLKLAKVIAEDLGKFEGNTPKIHQTEEAVKQSVSIFAALVERSISFNDASGAMSGEALASFSAWLSYGASRWQRDVEAWARLQNLTDTVIQCLYSDNFSLASVASDSIAAVLNQDSKILTKAQLSQLWPAINHALQTTTDQSGEERMPLLKLVSAWGKVMIPEILVLSDTTQFRDLFSQLTSQLFEIDWVEDGCEQLYVVTEFWIEFADQLVENLSSDWDEHRKHEMETILQPIIQAYFDTLDRKDDSIMAEVDPDYVEDWQRVRQDFAEFMIKLMETDFVPVYIICADQLEQALDRQDWFRIESVLQILNDMADDWDGSPMAEQGLTRIFKCALFQHLSDPSFLDSVTLRMKRIIVRFIDNYSFFFKQEPAQIPSMMTLLMTLLEQNIGQTSKLADLSAKCIASICSSCRKSLVGMLQDLLAFCGRALAAQDLSPYQKDKIYSGIAFVIEALPKEDLKIRPLQALMDQLQNDASSARALLSSCQGELGEQQVITTFQCLAAVGRALHNGPRQIIIDDDEEAVPVTNGHQQSPWEGPEGESISQGILSILQLISLIPESGDAWDGACAVLRVGLSETKPGPFVFSPSLISSFLSTMTPTTPRLESLITTACTFVSASSRSTTSRNPDEVAQILTSVSAVILSLSSPSADPALAQLTIDFLERLLSRYSDVLFSSTSLSPVLQFCLSALVSDAPMLKRTTASFIAAFLALPQQLARNEIPSPAPGLADFAQNIINDLLPHVASVIAHQIGGNAQRSELEAISKVLRAFIMASPRAKGMLEEALSGDAFPADAKVGPSEKRAFVSRIAMLRGGRGTSEAVKNFWAECRGTVGSY